MIMRISTRLILIGTVAACAPMLPEPPLPSMPQPETSQPMTPTTQPPATTPSATESVPDQAGFDGWKQGFLDRHGGARRAEYERELAGLGPDP
ncbi:MAG TPA: lytic murein transglycosylase, partial [Brevundimonas sp.]|nr:lytic murein transglycosylase [Brevundimonas sp.]